MRGLIITTGDKDVRTDRPTSGQGAYKGAGCKLRRVEKSRLSHRLPWSEKPFPTINTVI